MNFLEAVKAMKEGKKVSRKLPWNNIYIYSHDNVFFLKRNGEMRIEWRMSIEDIDATDWEVVEEYEYWNLAEQMDKDFEITGLGEWDKSWAKKNIEKCRDLILKDIFGDKPRTELSPTETLYNKIINKRFGDL
jgi:hypothetical protein